MRSAVQPTRIKIQRPLDVSRGGVILLGGLGRSGFTSGEPLVIRGFRDAGCTANLEVFWSLAL
jgi:hypothetical protein